MVQFGICIHSLILLLKLKGHEGKDNKSRPRTINQVLLMHPQLGIKGVAQQGHGLIFPFENYSYSLASPRS